MKFEYMKVTYIQEACSKYRFYENFKDEGVTVESVSNIVPVLNYYGEHGWEFITLDSGGIIFKRRK